MKVLLDHCLPRRLARHLPGLDVHTTADLDWQLLRNGVLLQTAADNGFTIFITSDRNIRHQQNLTKLPLSIVVLVSLSNAPESIVPLAPLILAALPTLPPRTLIEISLPTRKN